MKKPVSFFKRQVIAAFILMLLFAACFQFDFVNQPGSADLNSSFTVNISVTTTDGNGGEYYPYFGIKLPVGWTVDNNILVTYPGGDGTLVYNDSLSKVMQNLDPAEPGYYWWVSSSSETVVYNYDETYLFDPVIHTDDQAGTFYLDYMTGSNSTDYGGINYSRSDDHIITVGLPDEVVVTSNADSGAGTLREALEEVDYYGTISFNLAGDNTIVLSQELLITKDITIAGPVDDPVTLSGNNDCRIFYIQENRQPTLSGMVLTDGNAGTGYGGGIYCAYNSSPTISHLTIKNCTAIYGGGIYIYNADAILNDLNITLNSASSVGGGIFLSEAPDVMMADVMVHHNVSVTGGGIYCSYNSSPSMQHVSIFENTAESYGGGIYLEWGASVGFDGTDRCNIYLNQSLYGTDLYSSEFLDVVVDTFTVLVPDEFFAYPIENFEFDILHGLVEQVDADLYVSPLGSNSNNGLSEEEPLKTIGYALLKIAQNGEDPNTIHLTQGTYSQSTNGESFPIIMRDHVNLEGCCMNKVIIDAGNLTRGFSFYDITSSLLKNMTVTGGKDGNGGGIYLNNSTISLENLRVTGNEATGNGGGICIEYSTVDMSNVNVFENQASGNGGGIYISYSTSLDFDDVDRCNIYLNMASRGLDLYSDDYDVTEVVVDTFTVMIPNAYHAYPPDYFTFDILNGKMEQVSEDLYVSPEGDNANSGLSPDEPLKNLVSAFSRLLASSDDPVTVHLMEGTFSPSTTNEPFPVFLMDYVSLAGISAEETILDAEQTDYVMDITNSAGSSVSSMSITGGKGQQYYDYGYGIYINNSSPTLDNLKIYNNLNSGYGAGICMNNSSPLIQNTDIFDNTASSGAGIYGYYANPELIDITIHGNTASDHGGGIYLRYSDTAVLENITIFDNEAYYGGGISLYYADPDISNVDIYNNTAYYAGGLYSGRYSDPFLQDVTIRNNDAQYGGGMYFYYNSYPVFDTLDRCNIYLNAGDYGADLYTDYSYQEIVVDTFTVKYPKSHHAYPISYFTFDILNGMIPQVEADLYVSPAGNDENTGLTSDDPLKTIQHAMIKIIEDSVNLYTIHLLEGTYSPSTNGEEFPVIMVDYIKLSGTSPGEVILDAEGTGPVMEITDIIGCTISDLTIRGGNEYYGGGVYSYNADFVMENLVVEDNHANYYGGGLYFESYVNAQLNNVKVINNSSNYTGGGIYAGYNSSLTLENMLVTGNQSNDGGGISADDAVLDMNNVRIEDNHANYQGGGMTLYYSNITLKQVSIVMNEADNGGGIYNGYGSTIYFDPELRSNIYFNKAYQGKEIYSNDEMNVVVDTFTVMYPTEFFVYPLENFTFDILHYKLEQVNADLFVSPEGNDENGGLTQDDPLKTIYAAFAKIIADSANQNTVFLEEGSYGPSSNGEYFPLHVIDWVSIAGLSEHEVFLDGENQSGIMVLGNNQGSSISNLTFIHGQEYDGAGLYCYNSDPAITNVTFSSNNSYGWGGGMYCENSDPVLTNVKFVKNKAYMGGGLNINYNSNPLIQQADFYLNEASYAGGAVSSFDSEPVFETANFSRNKAQSGGAIFIEGSEMMLEDSQIKDNFAETGAGIFGQYNFNLTLSNTDIFKNKAEASGGGIYVESENNAYLLFDSTARCNVYLNEAADARDLYSAAFQHVVVDTFSVLYPTKFYASPLPNFEFDILHGLIEQVDDDLYVSPDGDNDNSGTTADDPLKTIYFANSKIIAGEDNPHVIHLLEGTYSAATNDEFFPVTMMDYVSLEGTSPEEVFLDAGEQRQVMRIDMTEGAKVSGMTVTGGQAGTGGGIYINNSSPELNNLRIQNNTGNSGGGIYITNESYPVISQTEIVGNTSGYGAGIYIIYNSTPELNDVMINSNQASITGGGVYMRNSSSMESNNVIIESNEADNGGGIYIYNSDPALSDITVRDNTAIYGGGIYFAEANAGLDGVVIHNNHSSNGGGIYCNYSTVQFESVSITENKASYNGGGIYYYYGSNLVFDSLERSSIYLNYAASQGSDLYSQGNTMQVIVDTFTVMLPKDHQAYPLAYYDFDILHGYIPQEEILLYVSPTGDNGNTGLTPEDPLKTIHYALTLPVTDTINIYDLQLQEGTFSPSVNGEVYPLYPDNYMTIEGEGPGNTILDAEGNNRVMQIALKRGCTVTDLTVTGGSNYNGGGIYTDEADPLLQNLHIIDNQGNYGGGLRCDQGQPTLIDIVFENNQAFNAGGGAYLYSGSDIVLENVSFVDNTAGSGGGLYSSNSVVSLNQSGFTGNTANYAGGGIYSAYSVMNLAGTDLTGNMANEGGGIYSTGNSVVDFDEVDRCNIFLNEATTGYDLYSNSMMHVVVDTFTVLYPKTHHAYPLYNFTFDILNGKIPQIQADVYISPDGDDNNSGLTPEDPLKTINYALSIVAEDSVNVYTVNLLEGVYGPSTNGESFPVNMVDHIILSGVSSDEVILDAEGLSNVITIDHTINATIKNMTITGGAGGSASGGGIHCVYSSPKIENIVLEGNQSAKGGAISITNYSSPEITNVTIVNNTATLGGGISCDFNSDPVISNVLIKENEAQSGAGIYVYSHSHPQLINTTIIDNEALESGGGIACGNFSVPVLEKVRIAYNLSGDQGGGTWCGTNSGFVFDTVNRSSIYLNMSAQGNDMYSAEQLFVAVDTFTVMFPKNYHAFPRYKFDFDIWVGLIPQINADIYVSPDGNNLNSGTTPEDPLRNIHFAVSVIVEDSVNLYNIYLANGIYSPSTNDEFFPLFIPDYVGLVGEDIDETILDAEQTGQVISLGVTNEVTIENLTITGGSNPAGLGGGIYLVNSSPHMSNIKLIDNHAKYGGAMFLEYSSPQMENVVIMGNTSVYGGGGVCFSSGSSPTITGSTIWQNEASTYGGAFYCSGSSSPVITNTSIKYNKASTGAAIYCSNNCNPVLDSVTISQNEALHSGGGVYAPYSNLTIRNSQITNNESTGKGGGIYLSNFTNTMENTIITGNTANEGGGIYISSSTPVFRNLLIAENQVTKSGGAVYMSVTDPLFINTTMSGNTAPDGSCIFSYRSSSQLVNSIAWNEDGNEVYFKETGSPSSISFSYSDLQNGENSIITNGNGNVYWLEGNIDEDPLFMGSGQDPWQLLGGSPCVDAGTPDTTGLMLPYLDLMGNPRIFDGDVNGSKVVDIGAYEYNLPTGTGNGHLSTSGLTVECYPNPVSDRVTFYFETNDRVSVDMEIRDISGNKVALLAEGKPVEGTEKLTFSLNSLDKGVYVVKITAGNRVITKKLVKVF